MSGMNYLLRALQIQKYINETAPLTATFPKPDTYMTQVVQRLRQFNLTKTEVFSIINLGIGLPRPAAAESAEAMEVEQEDEVAETNGETNGEPVATVSIPTDDDGNTAEEVVEGDPSARYLLSLVVEGLEERWPVSETEENIQSILAVLREYLLLQDANEQNGGADDDTTI
jgi:hypothetical protein